MFMVPNMTTPPVKICIRHFYPFHRWRKSSLDVTWIRRDVIFPEWMTTLW
jgi:hypothetical protein